MGNGKKVSAADIFARRSAEISDYCAAKDAYERTKEGAAVKAAREAREERLAAADARYAAENPPEDDGHWTVDDEYND
jgi:hypothetical protein